MGPPRGVVRGDGDTTSPLVRSGLAGSMRGKAQWAGHVAKTHPPGMAAPLRRYNRSHGGTPAIDTNTSTVTQPCGQ
eukprot:13628558-Alexandrium_andersonii.AAC.1